MCIWPRIIGEEEGWISSVPQAGCGTLNFHPVGPSRAPLMWMEIKIPRPKASWFPLIKHGPWVPWLWTRPYYRVNYSTGPTLVGPKPFRVKSTSAQYRFFFSSSFLSFPHSCNVIMQTLFFLCFFFSFFFSYSNFLSLFTFRSFQIVKMMLIVTIQIKFLFHTKSCVFGTRS